MKWLLIASEISEDQFLYTQSSTALGEGKRPVNYPISPLSARLRADLQVSSIGSVNDGILSSFFTNFCCIYVKGLLVAPATNFLNATRFGKGEVDSAPPPGSMAANPLRGPIPFGGAV